ncbi:23773_t:CDS:2, partial [Racocetra persica]
NLIRCYHNPNPNNFKNRDFDMPILNMGFQHAMTILLVIFRHAYSKHGLSACYDDSSCDLIGLKMTEFVDIAVVIG